MPLSLTHPVVSGFTGLRDSQDCYALTPLELNLRSPPDDVRFG